MAERNPHEDKNFQLQAVEQLREWIQKESKIKNTFIEKEFLLRFLRYKKFSIPDAFQLYVNYFTMRKKFRQYCENLSAKDPDLDHLINIGHITILPDFQGSPIMLYQYDNFDPKRVTVDHCIRLAFLVYEIISRDPRAQLNGFIQIWDFSAVTLDLLTILKPHHLKEIAQCLINNFPLRHRALYFVNVPSFAVAVLNIIKLLLSEKLRNRFKVFSGWEALTEELGASILPKELGGEIPKAELIKSLKVKALEHREEILALNDFEIELDGNELNFSNKQDSELDSAIMGSFRKLEVD